MSYSTLKDYALLSSENLHTAFFVGLLSTQEAKSDVIWVENKNLVLDIIKNGRFVALAEAVGTEFWQKWVNANFIDFINAWAVASGQRSLLAYSLNIDELNVDNFDTQDEQVLTNLRDMIVLALDADSICINAVQRIKAYHLLHKLGERQFYEKVFKNKTSLEDFILLITKGLDFFKFERYAYYYRSEEEQRINIIYHLCHAVWGNKKPKSKFTGKDKIVIATQYIVSYKSNLNLLRHWIAETGLKTDAYLFEAVYRTYVFGDQGIERQGSMLNFEWFESNSNQIISNVGNDQVRSLFEQVVDNKQTPLETIVEKFSGLKNKFRPGLIQDFALKVLKSKFADFQGSEIAKIESICATLDTLTIWTNVEHLVDSSKTTFEEFCNWALVRYSDPQRFAKMKVELKHLNAKFELSFEKLNELLEKLKNCGQVSRNIYTALVGTSLKVKHPFVTQGGWFTEAMLDATNNSGLDANACWIVARNWLANNTKNANAFFNALQKESANFNNKNALDCLQLNALYAYVGITFVKEPQKLLSVVNPTAKRVKTAVAINMDFIAHAVETVKSIKGGFDAKKYLSTPYAMTYFASKRKGKNLFSRNESSPVYSSTTSLYHDKQGLPGLQVADPFEKGYSWGNYEKLAKLCRVTDYSNISSPDTRGKRFAIYLLNYFVSGEPDALNAKLATTDAKSIGRVVSAIARSMSNYVVWNSIVDNFNVLRERRAEIIEYFSDKTQYLGNLVVVCKMLIETGKFLSPGVLPYAEMFANLSGVNLTEGEIAKYQAYMVTALKNKVSMSTIARAIRHADTFAQNVGEVPKKNIKAEPVVLTEQGVKARILDNGDLRALTIGLEISCCQYLTGHASSCAVATYEDPNYGIVLVDNIDQSKGTRPLAEAAVWISEGMVVIDSIEGLRKDASGYSKIAAAFDQLIKQWHAQGLRVGISTTDYGMTVQICNKLRREFGYAALSVNTPARPLRSIYTDVGNYVYEFKKV